MKYIVKVSKLKVIGLFLLGLVLVPVSLFVMNFLYETALFGKLIIILWVLLGLMLLISALLIPVSLALLVRYPGTYNRDERDADRNPCCADRESENSVERCAKDRAGR
jgi:hypothetical protein